MREYSIWWHSLSKINRCIIGRIVRIRFTFGWEYYGIRYLVKICRGQRPALHPGKVISGAAKRKEVYKEFRLFERG